MTSVTFEGPTPLRRSRRIAQTASSQMPSEILTVVLALPSQSSGSGVKRHRSRDVNCKNERKALRMTRVTPSPRKQSCTSTATAHTSVLQFCEDKPNLDVTAILTRQAIRKPCNEKNLPPNVYDLDKNIEDIMKCLSVIPDLPGRDAHLQFDSDGTAFDSTTNFLSTYGREYYTSLQKYDSMYLKREYDLTVIKTTNRGEDQILSLGRKQMPEPRKQEHESWFLNLMSDESTADSEVSRESENERDPTVPNNVKYQCAQPDKRPDTPETNGLDLKDVECRLERIHGSVSPLSQASSATLDSVESTSSSSSIKCQPSEIKQNIVATIQPYETHRDLTNRMRTILVDWLVEVCEECKLSNIVLASSIQLVDRVLNLSPQDAKMNGNGVGRILREMVQCVGCACVMIAAKMEDGGSRPPSVDDFVYLSDNTYMPEQILEMELGICTSLKFQLKSITPFHFLERFVLAACVADRNNLEQKGELYFNSQRYNVLAMMTRFLLEQIAVDVDLVSGFQCPSSKLAAAAVYLAKAACFGTNSTIWTETLEHYTGFSKDALQGTVLILVESWKLSSSSVEKAVFNKYSKRHYLHVANKAVPSPSQLGF